MELEVGTTVTTNRHHAYRVHDEDGAGETEMGIDKVPERGFRKPGEKPDAKEPITRTATPVFPVRMPRLPRQLFPINSEQDLLEKLDTLLRPRRPVTPGQHQLPASHAAPSSSRPDQKPGE